MKRALEFRSYASAYVLTRRLLNTADPIGLAILRSGSAATRFLGLRVRNPPWSWISVVSVVWCQAEVCATVCSLVQRSHSECGVCSECDSVSFTFFWCFIKFDCRQKGLRPPLNFFWIASVRSLYESTLSRSAITERRFLKTSVKPKSNLHYRRVLECE